MLPYLWLPQYGKLQTMISALSSSLVAALGLSLGYLAAVTQTPNNPEAVIHQLVLAIYGQDVDAYNRVTTEHPLRSRLTTGGSPNPDGLRRLKEDPEGLQIREMRPVLHRGKPVEGANVPAGATALFMVAHHGSPLIVPMVKRPDGWKVDVRWWIAGQQMSMSSVPPAPEHLAIRSLLGAMLQLDRTAAARFITDPRGIETLFAGAPRSREPSGVLEAAVMEMPLVEIGPGEFYVMPTGRVVEGGATDNRKVIVGLFGPTEIPFVLTRVNGSWRVEAEPYFVLMMQ
jgi:hypothetical protein